jgi:hypothetical protein
MSDTRNPRYGTVDTAYAMRLATMPADQDGPVWMVNLMKYRERAEYADGRESGVSGREADDLYAPFESLAAIGAEVVFVGEVDQQFFGSPTWDRIGVVKYPSRRSFIEMQSRKDFREKHAHKDAGMAETIVIGCLPIPSPTMPEGVSEVDWSDVAHPPTAADGSVIVLHVIRFDKTSAAEVTPAEMEAYQIAAAMVAVPHGVRISGWFAAEGTIVGDGRSWDQVRFNLFPSKAAFMAVAMDPARLEAQKNFREVAIADTYTMIVRPVIDRLAESVTA